MTSAELAREKATGVAEERKAPSDTATAVAARTLARMIGTLSWPPIGVALFTAFAFLMAGESPTASQRVTAVAIGGIGGFVVWLVLAALTNRAVLPERANPRSYFDLRARIEDLKEGLSRVASHESQTLTRRACQLEDRLCSLTPGYAWSYGTAYVAAWRDLHRLEEDFIDLERSDRLRAVLAHDELRVDGSPLARDQGLKAMMDEARQQLSSNPKDPGLRPLLREIRYAVNEFRDGAFDALVQARGTTERLCALLGLNTFVLLSIAVLMNASRMDIAVVSAVYLVGVAAGLVTRLRNGSSGDTSEDIYGYAQANDRQIILLSGLAGIAGVALSSAAGATTNADMATKGIALAVGVTPAVFLTAAVSGLAPGVLVDRLSTWAKGKFDDLNSTLVGQPGHG